MTPVEKNTEAAGLLLFHSISIIIDRKIAIRFANTTKTPYTINKKTQIADLSVVTPEQSKLLNSVETAILKIFPEGDPDLTTYLTELLRSNKPDQQNNTFWFLTPETLARQRITPQFRHES